MEYRRTADSDFPPFIVSLYTMQTASVICPLCNDKVDKLLYRFHLDAERQVLEQIRRQNPSWTTGDGICSRCVDYYHTEIVLQQRVLPEIGPYFPVRSVDDFIILPTGLRIDADPRYTGRGVTICFIDSGFCLHPDLTAHCNRVKAIVDMTGSSLTEDYFSQPHPQSWHGTMTTVVCAGDGYLGNGLYKGIASNAELVLLKVQDNDNRVSAEHIERALEWVLANHSRYNIRIVNMSVGADEVLSYKDSRIDILAEQLTAEGVVIVAAVGNDDTAPIKPPANSPSVISVGGLDDQNDASGTQQQLYHSSFGATIDALMKPEIIAPAIWMAAPLLPGTKEQKEAETLFFLLQQNDNQLAASLATCIQQTALDNTLPAVTDPALIKEAIRRRIQAAKYISAHYMHVEGTSFAAPVITAVIAQLLEANPLLTPTIIRNILFSSAKRLSHFPAERQGFGIVHPRKAILKVLKRDAMIATQPSPHIDNQQHTISFYMQHDCASQVALAGSFNHWLPDMLLMEPGRNGIWKIDIPMLPEGKYRYKFFIDDKEWIEDINNPYREPDGFSGFNSLFTINTTPS